MRPSDTVCGSPAETLVQFAPPSVDLNSTLPPIYSVSGSVGDTAIGALQLKRYCSFEIGVSPMLVITGRMNFRVQLRVSMREAKPVCEAAYTIAGSDGAGTV